MKKIIIALLLTALLAGLTAAALAEEAALITGDCALTVSDGSKKTARMTDGKYGTHWKQTNRGEGWIRIDAPEGGTVGAVTVCFDSVTLPWRLEVPDGEGWTAVFTCENGFLHETVRLENPAPSVRIAAPSGEDRLAVAELRVWGPGDLPESAQHWEPTHEKADILFLAAHADDELIFFGGAIPTYDTERGYRVVVAYLINCGTERCHELLDGLWSMGVRHYPVLGPYHDRYSTDVDRAYSLMGGKNRVWNWVVALVRQYKPEVVVTHAWGGEYGHGQHQVCARSMVKAFSKAADPGSFTASVEPWGTWQIKKLYLHLWKENPITMDWSVPLASLDGVTGIGAAERAFEFHVSQHSTNMDVKHTGVRYDNTKFGLYGTTVGPDVVGGDFMENITPAEDQP